MDVVPDKTAAIFTTLLLFEAFGITGLESREVVSSRSVGVCMVLS